MVVLRFIAMLCCVNLALPPGWCSMAFPPHAQPPAAAKHGGCCKLCGCKDREEPPPAAPKPVPPARCCCYELDWLKPPLPVTVQLDGGLVALLPPPDAIPAEPSLRLVSDLAIRGPSPPLHVLNCVWLC